MHVNLTEGSGPGTWSKWRLGRVRVTCPMCARSFFLEGATVGADGSVYPELACQSATCDFSARVRLDGWRGDD